VLAGEADGGPLVWISTLHRGVSGPYSVHVGADIAAKVNGLEQAAYASLEVDTTEHNRHIGGQSHVVEATPPVGRIRAGTGGCQPEDEGVVCGEEVGDRLHHIFASAAIHGEAPQRPIQPVHRPLKERLLSDPLHGYSQGPAGENEEGKVPRAGVWVPEHDELWFIREHGLRAPAQDPQHGAADAFFHGDHVLRLSPRS
jgi:hypothetical protein